MIIASISMRRSRSGERQSPRMPNCTCSTSGTEPSRSTPRCGSVANVQRFNLAGGINYQQAFMLAGGAGLRRSDIQPDRQRSPRRGSLARPDRVRRVAERAIPHRGVVGLLVGQRQCRLGRRPRLRRSRRSAAARDYPTFGASALAVALTGEGATDGSVAFGLNLNFSLDASRGFGLSRRAAGAVRPRPRDGLSRP